MSLKHEAKRALSVYNAENQDPEVKRAFHAAARSELNRIALSLNIPVQISTPKSKPKLLGESVLHADHIYIEIGHVGGEIAITYRACKDASDFIGGPNQYMSLKAFLDHDYAVKTFKAIMC